MPLTNTGGIAGLDGNIPIYDPAALWRIWSINEIYTGAIGLNKYIPKVNDYVIDPSTYTMYIVTALDNTTLIATLAPKISAGTAVNLTPIDALLGNGVGAPAESYRVLIDNSTTPSLASIDARCRVYGIQSESMVLFKGSTLDWANAISTVLDSAGNAIGVQVPLTLVASNPNQINLTIKAPVSFHITTPVADGEILTAVFYSLGGSVVSKQQVIAENTGFVRIANSLAKSITSIGLESPFMSATSNTVINMPLNVPTNALNLIAVINYSDGTVVRSPIDGQTIKVIGLDQVVSTIPGQTVPLVLSYMLSVNEMTSIATQSVNAAGIRYITLPFNITTLPANSAYQVKLFGYPVWVSPAIGYLMNWYLMNADRNMFYDVTSKITYSAATGPYDPKLYGTIQSKNVSLNLAAVSPTFKAYVHTQMVDIVLNTQPNGFSTPWTIQSEGIAANPTYGNNLVAKLAGLGSNTVDLSCNRATLATWLNDVYLNTHPIINKSIELTPPSPTHLQLIAHNTLTEYPIADWNKPMTLPIGLVAGDTLLIKFVAKAGITTSELAIAGMLVNM